MAEDSSNDRFGWGEGQVTFEDDDGTLVRVGRIPEEALRILEARGQRPRPMPELVDGVIHYPDGRTRVLDEGEPDDEPVADSRGRIRKFFGI